MEQDKASQYREELAYWLALNEGPSSVTPGMYTNAYHELGSLRALWEAPDTYLKSLGLTDRAVQTLRRYMSDSRLEDLRKQIDDCVQRGIRILRYVDNDYPRLLQSIGRTPEWPPLLLFQRGLDVDFEKCVAIVGTRDCSFHGRVAAMEFGKEIASEGYTVVSGLARGIDEYAHVGALMAEHGRTVAVLPFLEPVYPPEHAELHNDVIHRGAVISERYILQFQRSIREKLVQRNRITSGISRCVVAIESGTDGGTVRQVEFALSQGRKVFAFVSEQSDRLRRGYELFVRKGAIPVRTTDEVLAWLKDGNEPSKAQSPKSQDKSQETIESSWEKPR